MRSSNLDPFNCSIAAIVAAPLIVLVLALLLAL
jgi:hypothetical protein